MKIPSISVIIATYNKQDWLRKVLEGYKCQTCIDFDVIIADDGSTEETKNLIDDFKKNDYPVDITHLWHEDKGYRRQTILNKAIVAAKHEYILFTDGDCIPRADFVETHAKLAKKGYFLSGGYCKLPMNTSEAIAANDIKNQDCFKVNWLKTKGVVSSKNKLKLSAKDGMANFLNVVTPTGATFNNCNSSAWKSDLIAINGYDERMQYGGPDRELGERLFNYGIKGKQIRYSAICVHLDHARGYKTPESIAKNKAIREHTKSSKIDWTPYGIIKKEKDA
ncbi:glycosyltransferase family 2 protein [Sinomicrobium kalidii]|uniref:glycosyltransferase family 2 protein n=1 Tax=Sinomicrobium kalidii TaxID=2900738 RepID=UPI001E586916|nr:glycosyltransferase family 2 protein [Sinomicrobium kalidii]UGU16734.1 glycosyltransferase family 2 protein [Sinomicrobium kalidii]